MITITLNSAKMTKRDAIREAREINDQTGRAVRICTILGDLFMVIKENGEVITY